MHYLSVFTKKKLDSIAVSEHRINEFNKLNFIDLENYAKEKHFFMLANLWCNAKCANDKESLKIIEEKISDFKGRSKANFSGKTKLLHILSNINVRLLYFYYLYKKFSKQI